jgi:hypothetical protein
MTNSHTHCQAPQTNAQTQAWQRGCMWNRTTKTTVKPMDEKEERLQNSVYVAIAGAVANRKSMLLKNILLNGQGRTSVPLVHMHGNR